MRPLTINLDSDGVLADFVGSLADTWGKDPSKVTKWDIEGCWNMTPKEFRVRLREATIVHRVFAHARPIPGAVMGLATLVDQGHRVRVVTNKQFSNLAECESAQRQMISWLANYSLLPQVELCFTRDKSGYLADVIVDDHPNLEWAQPRAYNLLFDQPWNRDIEPIEYTLSPGKIERVHSWDEVLRIVGMVSG
jgi:hypothetical protein